MQVAIRRSGRYRPLVSVSRVVRPVAIVAVVAAALGALVLVQPGSSSSVRGSSSSVWLSAESLGRVVLAPARGERPSLAVEVAPDGAVLDVVETTRDVLVHDRTTGEMTVLDRATGDEVARSDAPTPPDGRAVVVAAGARAFVVDAGNRSARAIDPGGRDGPTVATDELSFSSWVGTEDGYLWITDDASGAWARFDGERFDVTTGFADPGTPLLLSSIGTDPVVLDTSTDRLRWLRRNVSSDLPGAGDSEVALLQQPDPDAACVTAMVGTEVSCVTPDGTAESVTVATPAAPGDQLLAGRSDVVLARPGVDRVGVIDREAGTVTTHVRADPSTRALVARTTGRALIVDDPGSGFALTVERGRVIPLDKVSVRTVVITGTEVTEDGVGTIDEDADVAGVFAEDADRPLDDDDGTNDPPTLRDDEAVTRSGRAVTIAVLANDLDPEGDALSIKAAGPLAPADGSVEVLQGSRVQYRPPDQTVDTFVTFPYIAVDESGLEGDAQVRVEVIGSGRNTPPRLEDDEFVTLVNRSVEGDVTANDQDAEGDPLTITAVGEAANGTVAIAEDGVVRYEPRAGFVGADSFEYTVVDGFGGESSARVTVDVQEPVAANRPPVARDDRTAVQAGVRSRIDALANDDDPDGDAIRIVAVSALSGVELSLVGDGAIDILAGPTVSGLLSFTYTIRDAGGLEDVGRVALVVERTDEAQRPIAVDDQATSAGVEVTIDVVANDVDPAGGQLVVDTVTQPATGGSVAPISPTTVSFVPTPGFVGTARFTYEVRNAAGLGATANVVVEVTAPSGSGPVARDDSASTYVGERVVISALANDRHPDGLPFDYVGTPTTRGGSAVVNADRTITYRPPADEVGTFVITYSIQDRNLRRSSATITVTVRERPVENQPPVAVNDIAQVPFGESASIDVLVNDDDPDDDTLRITRAETAVGSAEIAGSRIRYTPPAGFSGVVAISYTIADPDGATANATLTVQVSARVTVPPIARPDQLNLITETSGTVAPLANDVDPDGAVGSLVLVRVGSPVPAGVTVTQTGNSVRVTAGRTTGTFEVSYTVADADQLQVVGTIVVVVSPPPNTPPVAVNDTYSGLAVDATVRVLDNDIDPDGGVISLAQVGALTPSSAGSAALAGDRIALDLTSTFQGTATVPYTIRDAQGATSSATLTLSITACPAVPTLSPISIDTPFRTPVTVPLFPDGVPSGSTVSLGTPTVGSVTPSGGGAFAVYTPTANLNGNASFTYSVRTTCNAVATNTVTVTVNRSPTAIDDAFSIDRNLEAELDVLANDVDPDDDQLRVQSVGNGQNGTPSLLGGKVFFRPATGFTGTASFTYRIADPAGSTSTARVTLTVANAAPTANPDTASIPTQTPSVSVPVTANDTDPNNDTLELVNVGAVSPASAGTATRSGNSIVFTPAPGLGPTTGISITYRISDGLATAQSTLTITVVNRPPIANPDVGAIDTATETSVAVDVLANDTDPDGTPAQLTLTGATVAVGSLTRAGGVITWTPPSGIASGTVLVSYTITDADGGTAQGSLTISVTAPPPPTTTTTTTTTTIPGP